MIHIIHIVPLQLALHRQKQGERKNASAKKQNEKY
jgi:hypothetical protein